jgi:hypothetical protein
MEISLLFPNSYSIEHLLEICPPYTIERYYYPGGTTYGGKDGPMIRVTIAGGYQWIGIFERDSESYCAADGIFSCPNPDEVCIVCGGAAYCIMAANPTAWSQIPCDDICEVRQLVKQELIIFVDNFKISAYGPKGLAWRTDRLAHDGITIINIDDTANLLEGYGLSPIETESRSPFYVDLATGRHRGGFTRR